MNRYHFQSSLAERTATCIMMENECIAASPPHIAPPLYSGEICNSVELVLRQHPQCYDSGQLGIIVDSHLFILI